ncbi:MAG: VOC family protein [Burkholderiales bacterium]
MRTLDHLVVAARTLAEGVDWCEATLGVRPTAGGQHLFMGTRNRVFDVSSAAFPRSYLEIVAVDPSLPAPPQSRWFDLDDPALQEQLARGPALVHRVDRVDDIDAAHTALLADGIDCGVVTQAERGALRWRITLRADGRRAPTLIEWAGAHPTDAMSASGVQLDSLSDDYLPLSAVLITPRGRVTLAALPLKA